MKLLTRIILILVLSWILSPTGWAKTDVKEAVVKIFTDRDRYDYEKPWQKMRIENATGSGFIISGKRILTNAHVVADEDFIQVRKAGDAKKYIAEVEAESHQSDLATLKICEDGFISDLYNLKVAEDAFFSGVNPIELGNSAKIGDRVTIYGFPRGGEELSIKEAQIYRIEHAIYSHPFGHSLLYKIDKPIIGGNSGGPVLKDNRLVGVAFQSGPTEDNKNSGEIIAISIVSQFLTDIADGKHDGIPSLGITVQKLENPDFKLKLGMEEKYSGVLVINVDPESPARGLLKPGDVILSINRQEVDGDKKIELSKGIRTYFTYAIQTKQIGDIVTIKILRNSRIMRKRITLSKQMQFDKLVPRLKYSTEPTYFILGGLVFQPLTMNYLRTYGKDWGSDAPSYLLNYFAHGKRTYNRKEIIVLTQVLSDEINVGYDALEDSVISYVNNKQISTMRDLVKAFQEHRGEYHTITDEFGHKIILDRKKVNRRGKKILKKYGISSDRSRDLE